MFRFAQEEMLYLLLVIPLLFLLFLFSMSRKRRAMRRYGDKGVVTQLLPDLARWRQAVKYLLFFFALALVIVAIARPQLGSRLEKGERKGIDLFICLDVSNSMLAQDIQPDRLSRARNAIGKMIDELKNDRIGIVVFAGKAYMQLPITTDYAAAKLFVSTINTDLVPTQGTAIGEALNLAMSSFDDNKHSKAIIVITDGENHEDDAVEAAREAASKGIRVFTVGMGSPDGAPIPVMRNGVVSGFKKDKDGGTVVTRLNDQMLQNIAAAGQGAYVRASNTQQSLQKIFDEISGMQQTEFEARLFSDYEDRFQYLLLPAFLLLILEMLMLERRNKWLSRFRLFANTKPGK